LATNNAQYCWGFNRGGAVGDGTIETRTSPVPVGTPERFVRISVGEAASCGIRADGVAYCWGENFFGELGDGETGSHRLFPAPVDSP
jgi:serine/threonine-protein kinase